MAFEEPNGRARVMHQVVDRLIKGARQTLNFQSESEARRGLEALHEVATLRRIGIVVEVLGGLTVEVRLIEQHVA